MRTRDRQGYDAFPRACYLPVVRTLHLVVHDRVLAEDVAQKDVLPAAHVLVDGLHVRPPRPRRGAVPDVARAARELSPIPRPPSSSTSGRTARSPRSPTSSQGLTDATVQQHLHRPAIGSWSCSRGGDGVSARPSGSCAHTGMEL